MRVIYASVAMALASEECMEDTVLLQVKTSMPDYDPAAPMTTDGEYPVHEHIEQEHLVEPAGTEYPPINEMYPEEIPGCPEEDVCATVAAEFNLPVEAVEEFVDEFDFGAFPEIAEGDTTLLEECVTEFCIEEGGTDCEELAFMAAEHAVEEFHDQEPPMPEEYDMYTAAAPALTQCEEEACWEDWKPDENGDWHGHYTMHLNYVTACTINEACDDYDWECEMHGWDAAYPKCQWPAIKYEHDVHPSGIDTIEELPDGEPDQVCLLEYDCHWDHQCICESLESVLPNNRNPCDASSAEYWKYECGLVNEPFDWYATCYDDFMNNGFYMQQLRSMVRSKSNARLNNRVRTMAKVALKRKIAAFMENPKKAKLAKALKKTKMLEKPKLDKAKIAKALKKIKK